jgi:hypothetical protein
VLRSFEERAKLLRCVSRIVSATMNHFGALLHALLSSLISHFVDKLRERIGNPVGISVRHIAEMVTKSSCSESKPIREPLDKDVSKCGCPDITRVR